MRDIFEDYKIFNIDPAKLRSKEFFKNMLEYRDSVFKQFKHTIKKDFQFQCHLCGSKNGKEFLNYKGYKLFECKKCSLVSPNIDLGKLGGHEVYDNPAYVKDVTREILDTYDYRKNTYAPERLNYVLNKTKLPKSKIKLLDVGCGPGYFISHLKDKKIKYKGLELADFLVKICKQKKLNVEKADLKNEPAKTYNVITLFDVLEHLANPIEFFKTLNNKLTKGGYVLAYTPHIHSVAFHLMGGLQNTLLPFQHFAFYDPKSLDYLAQKTGFKVHSTDYYGLDIMDYLYMKEYQELAGYHQKLKNLIPIMQAIIDKQKLSNHIRIFFKKI